VDAPVEYEIPPSAVTEAIVNAVAHRDYTSTWSVQVMLFRNRLEIWNPGELPYHLTVSKLKEAHGSFPPNPILAEPMYLAGFIERMGTGIPDMIASCLKAGLKEPEIIPEADFKPILRRKIPISGNSNNKADVTDQATDQVSDQVQRLILVLGKDMSRQELMNILDLKHNRTFRENYLYPSLEGKWIEMTIPDAPNHPDQKYRLTEKGKSLKQQLKAK
jgi:predicted HTH transcriptional regulator